MQWEYRTIKLKGKGFWGGGLDETQLDDAMNELGREGWELVSVLGTNEVYGKTRHIVAIFKRPL